MSTNNPIVTGPVGTRGPLPISNKLLVLYHKPPDSGLRIALPTTVFVAGYIMSQGMLTMSYQICLSNILVFILINCTFHDLYFSVVTQLIPTFSTIKCTYQ